MKSPPTPLRCSSSGPALGLRFAGPLSLAIALAFEDDLVGVVGESVDGALGEDGIVEERDPLVDGSIGSQYRRSTAVPFEDDLVEVTGLLGIETAQREVVDDEDVWSEQATEDLLGGMVGASLVKVSQQVVGAQEQDVATGPAGGVTKGAGEKRLADADGTEEDDVLLALEEAEAEEIADAIAVEGNGGVLVEALQGLLLLESGAVESEREVLVVAPIDLVLEDEFEQIELSELRLLRVGDAVGKRREHSR